MKTLLQNEQRLEIKGYDATLYRLTPEKMSAFTVMPMFGIVSVMAETRAGTILLLEEKIEEYEKVLARVDRGEKIQVQYV